MPSGEVPPPEPLALLVCDNFHRDTGSGKPYILGCFATIGGRSFPLQHPHMVVYVVLTNGRGRVPIKITIADVDEEREPVFQAVADVDFTDPRAVVDMICPILGAVFPEPGEYRVALSASGTLLMERRLLVIQPEELI